MMLVDYSVLRQGTVCSGRVLKRLNLLLFKFIELIF